MRFLKEANFEQETEIDTFVDQLQRRFNPYFEVVLTKDGIESHKYFSNRYDALKYYNDIVDNMKEDRDEYYGSQISLIENTLQITDDEIAYFIPGEDEEDDMQVKA